MHYAECCAVSLSSLPEVTCIGLHVAGSSCLQCLPLGFFHVQGSVYKAGIGGGQCARTHKRHNINKLPDLHGNFNGVLLCARRESELGQGGRPADEVWVHGTPHQLKKKMHCYCMEHYMAIKQYGTQT